uniref:Ribosomal RNA methyltransferase SPB1-like C-terminal domain-containing protein n=1 Tax=Hucho hucho TaxID=62062 RepID=A0A4W5QPU7_9TELE
MKKKNKMTVAEKKEKEAELEEVEMEKKLAELNAEKVAEPRGSIAQMKKAKGSGDIQGDANGDDFQVVPVESTSEQACSRHECRGFGPGLSDRHVQEARERPGRRLLSQGVSSEDQCEVPEWFVDDEKKHMNKPIPVTKKMVEEYKAKWKEINARPIKRVAEAKRRLRKGAMGAMGMEERGK